MGFGVHTDFATVPGTSATTSNRFRNNGRLRVRCHVNHFCAGVLVLPRAGKGDGQRLALCALAHKINRRVLHGYLRTQVAVDPLHRCVFVGDGTLGDQVVHVVRPVLNGRVANAGALLDDDFDYGRVQRVTLVDGSGAALDVVNIRTLVRDDEGSLKLAHVLGVDSEIGLQGNLDVHALGNVDERSARPHSRVEGCELVVTRRDDRPEVFLEELRVLLESRVGVHEDDTLLLELFIDLVVDHLRFVLSRNPSYQTLALSLRDSKLLVGVFDLIGEVFPRLCLTLGRANEVLDVLEVDPREVGAPIRHWLAAEHFVGLESALEHPCGLVFASRNIGHDGLVDSTFGGCAGYVGIVPTELVVAQALEFGAVNDGV
ncbi:unannotated protein [freshwater metagenome]|uniref:Unannotated protein n=1 Tax=freshwater metagenome TaxID=449393 RepID=A0A6J6DG30_9ZZZZ